MDFSSIRPADIQPKVISREVLITAVYPLSQIGMVLSVKTLKIKSVILGAGAGLLILFLSTFQNIAVLGEYGYQTLLFPTYEAVSVVQIGAVFERVEVIYVFTIVLTCFYKYVFSLKSSINGIDRIFPKKISRISGYVLILSCIILSSFLFTDYSTLTSHIPLYCIYSSPVLILLPVLLAVTARKAKGIQVVDKT